ncbi:MATE family efflux transporter [Ferruginibacter yonginensis]|uniref:Multidrug-efflux transporter n=1 Tax=Ferruginibacter yonginensis TaxID=1310416 RepID=A0ABV8QP37_9BACT
MSITSTFNDLKVEVTNKQVLSIALPITLSIFIPQLNMLINSIFLGKVSGEALGNAGITGVFYLIFAVAGHGLNNAMQTVFSKNAGSGNPENFKTILSQGIRISLQFALIGILFTWLVAPYIMQAVADPKDYPQEMQFLKIRILGLPFLYLFQMGNAFLVASLNSRFLMFAFICEAAVNILFDWLLIFGNAGFPAMGFNGAAVASILAEFTGMAVVLSVIITSGLKSKYQLLQSFKFQKEINQQILKVSLPLVAQYVISVTTWLVFFLLLEGRGTNAKAISNVMRNVFGLAGVFIWAFASTCNTMVGNLMGQQRFNDILPAIKKITFWSISFCAVPVLILNIYPEVFFNLFGQDEQFIKEGIAVIRMVSLGMMFMSIANIWLNGVTGTGKTNINLMIEIIAISLYLGYTYYFMKINYMSLAMGWSNEFVYWSVIFTMSFLYLRTGKWKPITS